MIAQIETAPLLSYQSKVEEFQTLLILITTAEDLDTIMSDLRSRSFDWFEYGRGSSHIWIHEKGSKKRIILIQE